MSYPHRVLQAVIWLKDEESGECLATKIVRVHETDIKAGRWMLEHKMTELWRDITHHMPNEVA